MVVKGQSRGEARTGSGSREGSEGAASTGASGADVGTGGTASVDLVGDESGQTREAEFASISAGTFHTCGVMVDGFVACWGGDYFGQSTTPAGKFAAVSAGRHHTCGLLGGRTAPESPAGAVGPCGVRMDGQSPAGGTITSRGVRLRQRGGGYHTCGVEGGRLRRLLGGGR